MLAQAQPNFIERIMALEIPTAGQYIDYAVALEVLPAVLLFAAGLVYLLQGWRIFKILVIVNAAVLGALLGAKLGWILGEQRLALIMGVCGAVLLAVLSWPLMKFAVSIMGALAGSLLGFGVWVYVAGAMGRANPHEYAWAGALIGLITLGLLAFVIFRQVIIVFTSLQGSALTLTGLLGLLLKSQTLRESLTGELTTSQHLLPLLLLLPAVIGVVFQNVGKKKVPAKKPTEA